MKIDKALRDQVRKSVKESLNNLVEDEGIIAMMDPPGEPAQGPVDNSNIAGLAKQAVSSLRQLAQGMEDSGSSGAAYSAMANSIESSMQLPSPEDNPTS